MSSQPLHNEGGPSQDPRVTNDPSTAPTAPVPGSHSIEELKNMSEKQLGEEIQTTRQKQIEILDDILEIKSADRKEELKQFIRNVRKVLTYLITCSKERLRKAEEALNLLNSKVASDPYLTSRRMKIEGMGLQITEYKNALETDEADFKVYGELLKSMNENDSCTYLPRLTRTSPYSGQHITSFPGKGNLHFRGAQFELGELAEKPEEVLLAEMKNAAMFITFYMEYACIAKSARQRQHFMECVEGFCINVMKLLPLGTEYLRRHLKTLNERRDDPNQHEEATDIELENELMEKQLAFKTQRIHLDIFFGMRQAMIDDPTVMYVAVDKHRGNFDPSEKVDVGSVSFIKVHHAIPEAEQRDVLEGC